MERTWFRWRCNYTKRQKKREKKVEKKKQQEKKKKDEKWADGGRGTTVSRFLSV